MNRRLFLQGATGTLSAGSMMLGSSDAMAAVNGSDGQGSAEASDFLHNRTVIVDGWMLAECEAAAYVRDRRAR
jgi:hypothetical protein